MLVHRTLLGRTPPGGTLPGRRTLLGRTLPGRRPLPGRTLLGRRTLLGPAVLGLAVLGSAATGLPAAAAPTPAVPTPATPATATPASAASTAAAPTTTAPAAAAAGWLATRLVGGNHLETSFNGSSFPDQGLTVDAVLAFDAAKVGQDAATRATTWLAGQVAAYAGNGTTESYTGAHAKLALVAEVQGLDPEAFGGRHLLTELRALQAPSGRFSDTSTFGDFSNGVTQSLAILALHRAGGSGVPAAAVNFLAGSRCQDGGFPVFFGSSPCTSDPDATGFAVQALLAVGRTTPVTRALNWLVSTQQPDGGFGPVVEKENKKTVAENSNSTALAAQALRAGGRIAAADRAVGYLVARQVGCSGAPANRGAIAYDKTGFAAGTAPRATAQAVPALAGVGLVDVSSSGAAGPAPRLACASPTPTPTSTPPPATHTAAPTATPTATATGSGGAAGGAAGGGALPATGSPTGALTGAAALLLAAGTGLVVLGRQRRRLRRTVDR